jgi:hypothetical protein
MHAVNHNVHNSGDTEWVPYITEARELLALHKQALIRDGHIPANNSLKNNTATATATATAGVDNSNAINKSNSAAANSSARKKQSAVSPSNSSVSRAGVSASAARADSSSSASRPDGIAVDTVLPNVTADTAADNSGADMKHTDATTDDSQLDVVVEGDVSIDNNSCSTPVAAKQTAPTGGHVSSANSKHAAPQATPASQFSFYQLHDGQHVYLHPISMRCLLEEFGDTTNYTDSNNNTNSNSDRSGNDNSHDSNSSSDGTSGIKQLPAILNATVLEVRHECLTLHFILCNTFYAYVAPLKCVFFALNTDN